MKDWRHLDEQMRRYKNRLIAEVKLTPRIADTLATAIEQDVLLLSTQQKQQIRDASPIAPADRLAELQCFQSWLDIVHDIPMKDPVLTRAEIMAQNYMCFVYLPEACFSVLARVCASASATRKCSQFLTKNPVRAFRNSIAHANWTYRKDFKAIEYWSKRHHNDELLERFEVEQKDLTFWQALSKCVAYVMYSSLE
jgi:hypothetical protein